MEFGLIKQKSVAFVNKRKKRAFYYFIVQVITSISCYIMARIYAKKHKRRSFLHF